MIRAGAGEKGNRHEPLMLLGDPHSEPTWQYGGGAPAARLTCFVVGFYRQACETIGQPDGARGCKLSTFGLKGGRA